MLSYKICFLVKLFVVYLTDQQKPFEMNASEHSILFKSKSGRHFGISEHQNQDRKTASQIRAEKRHAAFSQNRIIHSTPARPTPAKPSQAKPSPPKPTTSSNNGNEAVKSSEPEVNEAPKNEKSSISRKKAYREKFKQYLEKKAAEKKAKSASKPFVSACACGRFMTVNDNKKNEAKKKNVVKMQEPKPAPAPVIPQCETPRFSPINTRSKKLTLISPQDQTPKRKSRSKIREKQAKLDNKPSTSKTKQTTTSRKNLVKPNNASAKKFTAPNAFNFVQGLPKVKTSQPLADVKPKFVKPQPEAAAATQNSGQTGAVQKFIKLKDSKANINFMTSTVVKMKPTQKPPTKSSVNIFNDSISPIEDLGEFKLDLVKPLTPKQIRKLKSETPGGKAKISPFVSPCVVMKRSGDIQTTPVNSAVGTSNDQKNDDICVTPKNSLNESATCSNYVSPFVTIARGGRSSNRKEKEARQKKYVLESRKSLDLNQSIDDRQHKEAAQYFHLQVSRETDRFKKLIAEWQEYSNEHDIPSEYEDLVDVAIGQTQLLISSKFKQFIGLIIECEQNVGEKPVKPEDLEGFWSMVYIQVEQLNQRFERLEMLKSNNWEDPALVNVPKQKKLRRDNAMVSKKPAAKKRVNSALAAMLKEARKKYIESKENKQQSNQVNDVVVMGKRFSLTKPATPQKSVWNVSTQITNISIKNQNQSHFYYRKSHFYFSVAC